MNQHKKKMKGSLRKALQVTCTLVALFSPAQRRQCILLLAGSSFLAVGEVLALGLIGLFISAVANPDIILNSQYSSAFASRFSVLESLSPRQLITILGILTATLMVFKNGLAGYLRLVVARFYGIFSAGFAKRILTHILCMPYPWVTSNNPADLMTHINWGLTSSTFLESIHQMLSDLFLVVLILLLLIMINPTVVFVVIALLGTLSALIFIAMKHRIDTIAFAQTEYKRRANRRIHRAIYGFKDIRIFGRESEILDSYHTLLDTRVRMDAAMATLRLTPGWIVESSGFVLLCAVTIAVHSLPGLNTTEVVAILGIIALSAWRGLPAIIRILNHVAMIRSRTPEVQRAIDFNNDMVRQLATALPPATLPRMPFERTIALRDIRFSYDKNSSIILESLDLTIKKGQSIGIIGRSGAGKSTLVDILIGFLQPTAGGVFVDGEEITGEKVFSWMRTGGYVPQTPYIFDGTLAENIAYTNQTEQLDRDHVLECCRQAAVTEFLDDLPAGLDSHIGDRGLKLSGGQRQRVAIARALYTQPEYLVFDEATSSLDSASEQSIQKTIDSLQGKMTLIIIAHRHRTVRECDTVLWLHKGRIRAEGPPEKILQLYEQEMCLDRKA